MKNIDAGSIDLIISDLPYQITRCSWDTIIPFDKMWEQFNRIARPNTAVVLTACQPFTSQLVMSNVKNFKHEWIWVKDQGVNFQNAKREPLKKTESVLVFYRKPPVYNPQGLVKLDKPIRKSNKRKGGGLGHINSQEKRDYYFQYYTNYPNNLVYFKQERGLFPTQKPVGLYEYFIKTYSNEGATVLDATAGSGTAAIACINTNRNYILIEKEKEHFDLIVNRIDKHKSDLINGGSATIESKPL